MQKILRIFSTIVISLFVLALFGWMSVKIANKEKKFGFITSTVKFMYSFPDMFSQSVEEAKTFALPETFIKTPADFQAINKLESDLIVLTAYSDTGKSRTVALMNLRNDSVIRKWNFSGFELDHERIFHPLLLPGQSLVYAFRGKTLRKVDSASNLLWEQRRFKPHHSKNVDSHGNLWVCGYYTDYLATGYYKLDGRTVFFKDEYILKIDSETGEILFVKSLGELLAENNLSNYLLKSGNIFDPIHSNDIEPAMETTPYYKKDDIFISAKNLSAILHYRPATNELIEVIEGPFNGQHDVDFYDKNSIVFFNNNCYTGTSNNYKTPPIDSSMFEFAGNLYSQIVKYNFEDKSYSFIWDSVFRDNKIYSSSEGLIDFYEPNTCFIEEQNKGVLWVIKDGEVIYKNVIKSIHKGFHNLPNWTRIIKDDE